MMTELAHFALCLALAAAVVQTIASTMAARTANQTPTYEPLARFAAIACLSLCVLAFAGLVTAFVRSDFSVSLVANHSHSLVPLIYKISGAWANHEGSMLLWCLVMAAQSALMALGAKRDNVMRGALGVQGGLLVMSLAYTLLTSNPFLRLESPPFEGADLNPLLQDPSVAVHPPLLFIGYIGLSAVFSIAVASLWLRTEPMHFARLARPWTLGAWSFLGLGMLLGAYWAYYELGWGGYWFWDPVENASLMPWIIAGGLLHTLVLTARNGQAAGLSFVLALSAFSLSLIGTFLVRSGAITSVHAFALDPARGLVILGMLAVTLILGFGLFATRPPVTADTSVDPVSRGGALLLNGLFACLVTAIVLLGTIYPLLSELAFGRTAAVGAPYYTLAAIPLMMLGLSILPVGTLVGWQMAGRALPVRQLCALAVLAVLAGLTAGLSARFGLWPVVGLILALWLLGGVALDAWHNARRRKGLVIAVPFAHWGRLLAHFGLGVFCLAVALHAGGRLEQTLLLAPGGAASFAGYQITLESVDDGEGPNYYTDTARVRIDKPGLTPVFEYPERRFYPASGQPTTETSRYGTMAGDLYFALGAAQTDPASAAGQAATKWALRVYYNPFVSLIFLGFLLTSLGGGLALVMRLRAKPPEMPLAEGVVP